MLGALVVVHGALVRRDIPAVVPSPCQAVVERVTVVLGGLAVALGTPAVVVLPLPGWVVPQSERAIEVLGGLVVAAVGTPVVVAAVGRRAV